MSEDALRCSGRSTLKDSTLEWPYDGPVHHEADRRKNDDHDDDDAEQAPAVELAVLLLHLQMIAEPEANGYMGVARPERFELPASWFVAMHSIQLSYGRRA